MEMVFVPQWMCYYYLVSIMILIPDWAFIMLRPRSLEGGDLGNLFRIFHLYGRVDKLFVDYKNKVVKYIYLVGTLDLFLCCYLFAFFRPDQPWFAITAICREVYVLTKTAIYLLYSYDFILPQWRLPVYIMNSQFVFVPMLCVYLISNQIVNSLHGVNIPQE